MTQVTIERGLLERALRDIERAYSKQFDVAVDLRAALQAAPAQPVNQVLVDDERALFEAHIAKDCGDLSTFGSGPNMHYCNSGVNHEWIGWKTRAALQAAPAQPVNQVLVDALEKIANETRNIGSAHILARAALAQIHQT